MPDVLRFYMYCSGEHQSLHSFPTRRSSDLMASADDPYGVLVDTTMRVMTWNVWGRFGPWERRAAGIDRKSTRLNSSHSQISYAVFCLKKKNKIESILYRLYNQTLSGEHLLL